MSQPWRRSQPSRLLMSGGDGEASTTAAPPSKKGGKQQQKGKGKEAEEEPLTGAALTAKENELKLDRLAKVQTMEAEGRSAFGATTYPVSHSVAAINDKYVGV